VGAERTRRGMCEHHRPARRARTCCARRDGSPTAAARHARRPRAAPTSRAAPTRRTRLRPASHGPTAAYAESSLPRAAVPATGLHDSATLHGCPRDGACTLLACRCAHASVACPNNPRSCVPMCTCRAFPAAHRRTLSGPHPPCSRVSVVESCARMHRPTPVSHGCSGHACRGAGSVARPTGKQAGGDCAKQLGALVSTHPVRAEAEEARPQRIRYEVVRVLREPPAGLIARPRGSTVQAECAITSGVSSRIVSALE
jgi:hypothetical protein